MAAPPVLTRYRYKVVDGKVTLYRAERDAEARMDIEISRTAMATAYHEAAHAVMAWKLGIAVKRVTIVPSKDAKGHCYHAQVVRGRYAEVDRSDRGRMEKEPCPGDIILSAQKE